MKTKQEISEAVDNIPLFEIVNVAIKQGEEWLSQSDFRGIVEVGGKQAVAVASDEYALVQFKDVFKPIVDEIDDFEGTLQYWRGKAVLDIFPRIEGGIKQYGLSVVNSVDGTSSVFVRFCTTINGRVMTLPEKVGGIKRVHIGKVKRITQDYLTVVGKVEKAWGNITEYFGKTTVSEGELKTIFEKLNIGERKQEVLEEFYKQNGETTLTQLFNKLIEITDERDYKTEIHRRNHLDKIAGLMYDYAVICGI